MKKIIVLLIIMCFSNTVQADTEPINLNYQPRVPFFIEDKKEKYPIDGIIFNIIKDIFNGLNINYKFVNVPVIRTMQMIQENKVKVCYPLGLRNAEREKLALISLPIYKDKNMIIVYNSSNNLIKSYSSLSDMLDDKNITLLLKLGYSYGKNIDNQFLEKLNFKNNDARMKPPKNIHQTSDDNIGMLNQILNKKSDYMLIAKNEVEDLIANNEVFKKYLKYFEFKDLPAGEYRHLICSKKVGEDAMSKINLKIKQLKLIK